jgi:hypothetical protein
MAERDLKEYRNYLQDVDPEIGTATAVRFIPEITAEDAAWLVGLGIAPPR